MPARRDPFHADGLKFARAAPKPFWMMASLTSISLSGMAAAQARLGASAHNIANAMTPDFRRQTVAASEQADGGVSTTLGRTAGPGEDLATDLVTQREALYAFKANLRVVQTADAMLGALLDTRA